MLDIAYEEFRAANPAAYDALIALGKSAEAHGLDKGLIELVKLRASQINGCAFCVDMHTRELLSRGVAAGLIPGPAEVEFLSEEGG